MQPINKYLLIIIILLSPLISNGQRYKKPQNLVKYDFKKLHFGFTLGINALNFNVQKSNNSLNNDTLLSILAQNQKGFNLGIVSNLRLGRYTDLRFIPTLVFGERILDYRFNETNNLTINSKRIESTSIDFPIYIKYKSKH